MAEETKIEIPNFSYPFKLNKEEEYHNALSSVTTGNYLFNDKGMWHGGIHFADQALTKVDSSKGIKAIADGELVAYRINDKYLQNSDEENKDEGLYSNGFFLIRHKIEYATSKLTFFSLYMHTAKKEDYYTHKIIGNPEYLRRTINGGEVHSLNSVAKDKRVVLDTKWTKKRVKVLYLENEKISETEPAYVHESNIEVIKEQESFSSISTILSGSMNSVVTLATPIKVKAGEIIGLVGEYNIPTKKDNKLLHLEVFTSDDVIAFASSAKNTFNTDTNENKLKPNKLKILKDKTIYTLKNIITTSMNKSDNIRSEFNHTSSIYLETETSIGTVLEIDKRRLENNRYLVTKIGTTDVSSQTWTVYKDSIVETDELKNNIFEISTEKTQERIIPFSKVKKIKDKDELEYLEYIEEEPKKYVKYSDCEESHGITFDWARIFKDINGDKVSIFENLEAVMNPTFYDKISGNVDEGIKLNSNFKELFEAIESDDEDNIIDAQELANASLDKEIKKLTSKYIVKHSSEWDKVVSSPSYIETMIQSFKEKLGNVEGIDKHLENEKIRVDKLSFFTECSGIEGFPSSDEVYHFNPIGLIGEFVSKSRCYCMEQGIISSPCNSNGLEIKNEHYEKLAEELGVEKEVLKAVAEVETGERGAFQRKEPKHATILYERHYFRELITSVSKKDNGNGTITITGKALLNGIEKTKSEIVSSSISEKALKKMMRKIKIESADYFSNNYPDLIGSQGNYGTYSSQLIKLADAKKLDEKNAIQSCSWGRFQVMGKYFNLIYKTPQELEKAQNQCELQHLVLFKAYLEKFDLIEPMKDKNWHLIAQRYNGPTYAINNYHTKMENSYNKYKKEW